MLILTLASQISIVLSALDSSNDITSYGQHLTISLVTTLAGAPGDGVWVESTGSWEFEVAAKKEVQKEEQMTQKAEDDEERRVIKEQWSEY